MIHLGDITKISGYDAPVVDVVVGGSPCQDLSVAGKRAGLAGERSGLYMEQIRIIKEMRQADVLRGRANVDIRPRYMVWENVPGAFSSNGGKDFATVIEEAIRVSEPEAPDVPVPEKGWPTSGILFDEFGRWSVAWRVLNSQFWGVPMRRRRIALVADFGGRSAGEILFEREGVRGYFAEGRTPWQATAGDAEEGAGADDCEGERLDAVVYSFDSLASNSMKSKNPYSGCRQVEVAKTLDTTDPNPSKNQGGIAVVWTVKCYDIGEARLRTPSEYEETCPTLTARCGTGGNNVPAVVFEARGYEKLGAQEMFSGDYTVIEEKPIPIHDIATRFSGKRGDKCDGKGNGPGIGEPGDQMKTLTSGDRHAVGDVIDLVCGVDCRNMNEYQELYPTLQAKPNGGQSLNFSHAIRLRYIVRRLTPLECERLQGFPDGWTDIGEWVDSKGKKHKDADSPRYKALGNSISIPPWKWVLKRICACYERDATMASLFDGIGGFPYIWEQLNGKGSCLWASEIEEFPMAVTKLRFGG